MKKAAVVVGVDRVGQMPQLRAAASGASRFADWARMQGFDVTLLTDEGGGAVELHDVKKAVKTFVNSGTYDQLVVFFSGHGLLVSPETEVWLLSGAPEDPDEAVSVVGSIWLARAAGVPHVLFVSDACRSLPGSALFGQVKGGQIFPNSDRRQVRPEVDVFYATLPGDPAYESHSPAEAAEQYRALFTSCLLQGLGGQDRSLVETIDAPGGARLEVVTSYGLKKYLERTVPIAAERVAITLTQDPDIRVESHPPKYFGEAVEWAGADDAMAVGGDDTAFAIFPGAPDSFADSDDFDDSGSGAAAAIRPAPQPAPPRPGLRAVIDERMRTTFRGEQAGLTDDLAAVEAETGLGADMVSLLSARGRDHFETTTGFTVIGTTVQRAFLPGGHCDPPFDGPEGVHVRVNQTGPEARSLLLEFAEGTGTVVAVLPEFIGAVYVECGRVVNVNYTPSSNTGRFYDYEEQADAIDERRAFVAAAARRGSFRLEPDQAGGGAQYLRMLKGIDPTLGVYAAYAYAQIGAIDRIRSVLDYMVDEAEGVPFDVALLADRRPFEPGSLLRERIAPFCPMLTQGWSILDTYGDAVHPLLRKLRAELLPTLWTTFEPIGLQKLWQELEGGLKP